MSRTIKSHFYDLPPPYNAAALADCVRTRGRVRLTYHVGTLDDAVNYGIMWGEVHIVWGDLCARYLQLSDPGQGFIFPYPPL